MMAKALVPQQFAEFLDEYPEFIAEVTRSDREFSFPNLVDWLVVNPQIVRRLAELGMGWPSDPTQKRSIFSCVMAAIATLKACASNSAYCLNYVSTLFDALPDGGASVSISPGLLAQFRPGGKEA